jgi:DNA-binding GntR family transcriptional regulator
VGAQVTAGALTGEILDGLWAVMSDLLRSEPRSPIPTAVDHAYEAIWRQLIGGERRPGERVTDTELASQLGLSRTPVRQALHRLVQEDLVRLDARRGFWVRTFTAEDVHEIYDIRQVLETLALRLAAPRLRRTELEALLAEDGTVREALGASRDPRTVVLFLQADLTLHNLFIRSSGNRRLVRILAALRSQQTLFQYWDSRYPRRGEAALDEHERILLALIAGRTEDAIEYLAQHIVASKNRVLGDLFGSDGRSPDGEPAGDGVPSEPDGDAVPRRGHPAKE